MLRSITIRLIISRPPVNRQMSSPNTDFKDLAHTTNNNKKFEFNNHSLQSGISDHSFIIELT